MKRAFIIGALLVASCDDIPRARTEAEIEDIAADVASDETSAIAARMDELEDEVEALRRVVELQGRYADAISRDLDSTRQTLSQNARAANANALRDMTRRGACGTRWEPVQGGGQILRNIECTEADLK